MENYGYDFLHKLSKLVTTLSSRKNCSLDLIPQIVRTSDFPSILHSKPQREFGKAKFKVGDRVRISKYDLPFRKGYKSQFRKKVFENVAFSSRIPPT